MNTSAPSSRYAFAVELVAAFTRDGEGGNLAGVVLDADGIDTQTRQRAATAVGVSETAFVRRADERTFEVEFFTPNRQVPDCGHATVATFARLAQRGLLQPGTTVKRTIAGDRDITVEGERVFMQQPRPVLSPFAKTAEIAQALGIPAEAISAEPVLADHGVRFVLVLTSRSALAAVRPDQRAIEALTEGPDAIGFYVAAPGNAGYDLTTRMFAPRYGIPEESATGMAAGLLAGYLARDAESARYRIEQGAFMPEPAPSEIVARVERDHVLVGGTASLVRTILLALEPAEVAHPSTGSG